MKRKEAQKFLTLFASKWSKNFETKLSEKFGQFVSLPQAKWKHNGFRFASSHFEAKSEKKAEPPTCEYCPPQRSCRSRGRPLSVWVSFASLQTWSGAIVTVGEMTSLLSESSAELRFNSEQISLLTGGGVSSAEVTIHLYNKSFSSPTPWKVNYAW